MSDLVQHVEYVGEADFFAKEINASEDGIFCLVLLKAQISRDLDVEAMVLEAMEKSDATALYSDILMKEGQFSAIQSCPSYFSGLLNSGLVIHSPIFVRNNARMRLEYNPNIKILHGHNYLRQIERNNRIIHIPELLYSVVITQDNILDIKDDLKTLNG